MRHLRRHDKRGAAAAPLCPQLLQLGIAEAVYQRVKPLPGLAPGAFGGVVGGIARQVPGVEQGGHGQARKTVDGGEYGGDAHGLAAVVGDGLGGGLGGVAGGNRCHQDQHVFPVDHRRGVLAEDQLAAHRALRGDHVHIPVGVDVHVPRLGHLAGHAGRDHLRAVQAQYGVDQGVHLVFLRQLQRHLARLSEAEFLVGDVNVIIDVAVAGGEMTPAHLQQDVLLGGRMTDGFHETSPPFFDSKNCYGIIIS